MQMPLVIKNKTDRIAFQFGSRSALRATNEILEQLQAQLKSNARNMLPSLPRSSAN
jgi:hypothetical protein